MEHGSMRRWAAAALGLGGLAALRGIGPLAKGASHGAAPIDVTWLGHAAFLIVSPGGTRLLIDPWLKGNPATPDSLQDLSKYHPDFVLVTHSHFDHSADAKALAVASGAPVIGTYDWVVSLGLPEKQTLGGNVGGTITAGDVLVHLVPAMHASQPDGRPIASCLSSPAVAPCTTPVTRGSSETWPLSKSFITRASCS